MDAEHWRQILRGLMSTIFDLKQENYLLKMEIIIARSIFALNQQYQNLWANVNSEIARLNEEVTNLKADLKNANDELAEARENEKNLKTDLKNANDELAEARENEKNLKRQRREAGSGSNVDKNM